MRTPYDISEEIKSIFVSSIGPDNDENDVEDLRQQIQWLLEEWSAEIKQ